MDTKPRLFVGVGNMGNPMAANLVKAGDPLSVFDLHYPCCVRGRRAMSRRRE